jgi:hypothetical protein
MWLATFFLTKLRQRWCVTPAKLLMQQKLVAV